GLYLLENIISFSKLYYYIMFLRTCKVFFDKKQKYNRLKLEQYTSASKTLLEIDFTVLIDLSCSCFILLYVRK
ncbi:hypothetical protein GM540_15025, partial [Streptococcus pneumoniae]|nr:hypothetical protein [Streptococcus pneumoniae]